MVALMYPISYRGPQLKIDEAIIALIFDQLIEGIPTQQKSHTAENEISVPYSRLFVYAAI